MNIFSISGLLVGITSFVLGIFIFLKSKNNKINKIWTVFCFFVTIWGFGGYKTGITQNALQALFWWKITYIGIIFIPVLFYHFIYTFLKLKIRKLVCLFYMFGLFFLFLEWSPWSYLFFSKDNISLLFNSLYWVFPPTPLFIFFVFSWSSIILYSHFELFKAFRKSVGLKREQIKYFFIATAIGFLGGSTCFLPCFGVNLYPFLNFSVPLYPIIITYAIVAHRLMDIKIVLRKSSVYLASLSTILIFAVSAQYVFYRFFTEISIWADFIILILSISLFPLANKYYYRLANKYFFTSLYDTQTVIMKLSDKLRSTMELKKIYKFISDAFIGSFHAKAVGVLLYNEKADSYMLEYNKGFDFGKRKKFAFLKQLKKMCESHSGSVIIEELKHSSYNKYKEAINTLDGFNIEVLTPLNIKRKNIGFIILGSKESTDIYNDEDLQVLRIIGVQAAITIENAVLYEKTKRFNVKLKKEVEKATAELRSANVKLKKLDVAKSDFISIASHQLRTPLTVIKGYISMLLEGLFGNLSDEEADAMEKVYKSNERLIQLVENLLNISRIESGRLQFDFKKEQLEKVATSVMEELSNSAKKKGLKLSYEKPAKPLPKVKIDENKIRQVILNLIDNSIKYTQKGSINVSLEQVDNNIQFCVSDTGMGISSEDLPKLFKRFSRGKDVSLVNANGSGLGLYVSKIMTEAHKGIIWCESKGNDKGAKFCFTIPISI